MDDISAAWRPIRNFLRRVDPKTALETLRYYSLYSGTPGVRPPSPPNYVEVPRVILTAENSYIFPWDVEIIAREVILSSGTDVTEYRYDLRRWRDFSNVMTKLKTLENAITRSGIGDGNILLELVRISHRQFPHQTNRMSREMIVRYGKLFTHPEMTPIVLRKTGLSYDKIITIGTLFWAMYEQYAAIEHPETGFASTDIAKEEIEMFLGLFSKPFDELKELVDEKHLVDNTFFYQYSPLTAFPLIKFEENGIVTYVCPSVGRFTSQITRGVYYMLFSDSDFDNAFGNSFEAYIGNILRETVGNTETYSVYSQETDPSEGKRRCDWIINQKDSFVMVECKTKRMAIGGYSIVDNDYALIDQLDKLADAVVQSYEGYLVYKGIGYEPPVYPYANQKEAAICVVTLENWYLFGTPSVKLDEIVLTKLLEKGIDSSLIQDVPYEVVGADTFERLMHFATKGHSLRNVFLDHINGSEATHEFGVFLNNNYRQEFSDYNYVLRDEMDAILGTIMTGQ